MVTVAFAILLVGGKAGEWKQWMGELGGEAVVSRAKVNGYAKRGRSASP